MEGDRERLIERAASAANRVIYDSERAADYVDGAPHVKHASLRRLYGELVVRVHAAAAANGAVPSILDLGAGEGSATLPFLELGARVTAVDVSEPQLRSLAARCAPYASSLELRCQDVSDVFATDPARYDVVVANSFLHHVPDYLGMVARAVDLLAPHGQFFSFQDPMRYDRLPPGTRRFGEVAYLSWRVRKGDLVGGARRRLRRRRGVFLDECPEDNVEYHATRNGVDQEAIQALLEGRGFSVRTVRYFSTQSPSFQAVGSALGLRNTFAILARRGTVDGG